MTQHLTSLPRASDFQHFIAEPLDFLARARGIHGNLFAIRDAGPVFSRASDCTGVVAVFGAENQRKVFSDIELFGMPSSAAQHLNLSQNLINLNRGLHSMRAEEHSIQRRFLIGILKNSFEADDRLVWAALEDFAKGWTAGSTVGLLGQMRELMLQTSSRVLFGDCSVENSQLSFLLQKYFHLRREVSSPTNAVDEESLEQLVAVGNSVDTALRMYVRKCRHNAGGSCSGIIARLANLELGPKRRLTEDEIVGHSNIVFVSSTEPMAVALTWILLILSQLPALRNELRNELGAVFGNNPIPAAGQLGRLALHDRVINESLRLLPPNAFMVRITTRATSLNGVRLPARCEVILCPFLAHRDSVAFQRPDDFLPERWKEALPSPFEYFPFGAGGHSCVGRNLATRMIKSALAFLLPRYDLDLAGDQHVDWRIHIMFMPRCDPTVTIQPLDASPRLRAGKLDGPVSKLLNIYAK